jgi:hypothetical protein
VHWAGIVAVFGVMQVPGAVLIEVDVFNGGQRPDSAWRGTVVNRQRVISKLFRAHLVSLLDLRRARL